METPVDQRVGAAERSPSGHIAPSGIAALKLALNGNASGFADWRRQVMTRKVLAALQDAAIHIPADLTPEDRMVQYGMTQGLMFAMQLVADPSSIWPGVFGKNTNEDTRGDLPVMDFDTSIDDAIGG